MKSRQIKFSLAIAVMLGAVALATSLVYRSVEADSVSTTDLSATSTAKNSNSPAKRPCCQATRVNATAPTAGCCQAAAVATAEVASEQTCAGGACQGGGCGKCRDGQTVAVAADQPAPQGGPPFGRGQGRGLGRGVGRGPGPGFGRGRGRGQHNDPRFVEDHDVFFYLLDHGDKITRKITNLPNGIETVTESDDPDVTVKIQEHVASMYDRVEKVNPIHMRDPLFRELFRNAKKIEMEMKDTEKGIWVRETSDDPYVASLLQEHAKTVSLFIKNGRSELPKNHALPAREEPVEKTTAVSDPPSSCINCQATLTSFAEFDRVYIPALALTKQEKPAAARAAMRKLKAGWKKLQPILGECRNDWSSDLEEVDKAIQSADKLVEGGKLPAAHEELEVIRDLFLELREASGMDYALDPLNRFHAVMEEIVKPAMALSPNDVDEEVRGRFAKLMSQAAIEWQKVRDTEFDAQRFQMDAVAEAEVQELIAAETTNLARFQVALQGDDPSELLKTARALKPGFAKVFMFFGEFPKMTGNQESLQAK
jgi:hypothetical protein